MPKMKTKRAAKKRVKMTASGKLKRYRLRKGKLVSKADAPGFKVLVPYI
jgi:ribosomal protein L35